MSDGYLLAIDVGTGSARAVLFTASGHQAGMGQREYSHRALPEVPGSQVFDTAKNWPLIGAMRPGGVGHARVYRPTPCGPSAPPACARAWCCTTATGKRPGLARTRTPGPRAEAVELISSGEAQEIYDRAGDWVAITAPARFRWIARHEPQMFAGHRARRHDRRLGPGQAVR